MLNMFRTTGKGHGPNVFLWVVLIAAILGLGGYSLVGVATSLSSQNVAVVADQKVSRQDYLQALQSSLNQMSRRFNTNITMTQARALGVDQQVLGQLVTQAALDQQTANLDLSAGDEAVRDALVEKPDFRGATGAFDKLAYDLTLESSGLRANEYEKRVRADLSRTLLEAGISGGIDMPDIMSRTMMAYLGEKRSYAYTVVPAKRVRNVPEPDDATLQAFFEEHQEDYRTVEIRKVTVVSMQPEAAIAAMEISDEDLRAEYDANLSNYDRPERRIVDRIVFPDADLAKAAKARIDAGDASFNEIGAERDLTPAELEVGEVQRDTQPDAIADAIFGAADLGVIGPVDTNLGPALYRLNAILSAHTTSFEEARDDLHGLLAARRVGAVIGGQIEPVQDLLAGGAPLEEIAESTDLVLSQIDVAEIGGEGLASDPQLRSTAFAQAIGDDPALFDLQDNGIAALRVDEIIEPAIPAFEDVTEAVRSDWQVVANQAALKAEADRIVALISHGQTFFSVMKGEALPVTEGANPVRRRDQPGDMPPIATQTLFQMTPGETRILEDVTGTYLLHLVKVIPYDPEAEENAAEFKAVQGELSNSTARDIFFGFTQAVQNEAGVSVNQTLIDQTLAQFP